MNNHGEIVAFIWSIADLIDSNFKFYKQITESPEFARFLFDWLFDRYLKRAGPAGDEAKP